MRKRFICAALAMALAVLSVGNASAKVKTRRPTFGSDFWLGDTLVRKGTYNVSYDDKTNEVRLADRQNTVAKSVGELISSPLSRKGRDSSFTPRSPGRALNLRRRPRPWR